MECGGVKREALRLHDGALVPVETEPAEIGNGALGGTGLDARGVDVLDPERQAPLAGAGGEPGDEIGTGVADVLGAGRGRGEATHGPQPVGLEGAPVYADVLFSRR